MNETAAMETVPVLSLGQRIVGLFSSPVKVFGSLRPRPVWLDVFLISIVAGVLTFLPIQGMVRRDSLDKSVQRIEKMENLSQEQKDRAIEQQETIMNGPIFLWSALGGVLIGTPLILLFWGLLVWLFYGFISGGDLTYRQSLAAVTHLNVLFIAAAAIKIPMMLAKGSIQVATSLALFSPDNDPQSMLYAFLDSFDFFTLAILAVMAVSMPALARVTPRRSWTMAVLLFVMGLLLRLGGAALGGMFS